MPSPWQFISGGLCEFCILAAGSSWKDPALVVLFCGGLHEEIQLELSCKDVELDLDGSISLAIKLDQHILGKAHRSQPRGQFLRGDLLTGTLEEPCC